MTGPDEVLRVAEDLELPADVITQRLAIIGRTGSGKTSTGVVLAEEMIRGHLPVVILDPLGVWHGLRSNTAGDGPGLPVVIFGGDHADLPLPAGSGQLIAEVIVEQRPAAVIDLSGLDSDAEIRRWCAAFLKQLYRLNRNPLHVIVDEADLLAPQQGSGEAAHSLAAMKSVARRGRVRGLGLTLITQRPASLAKEVLNQAELLVAMQLTGPRDVAAVDDWMSQAGDEATVREVRASLPSLTVGESWWWSPAWLRLLQRVQVRPRETFDSSRTPRPGETRVEPTATAEVDLEALADRLAALGDGDTAAGDDPGALRRRIADLDRQLRDRPADEPERVEVPVVLDDDLDRGRALVEDLRGLVGALTSALDRLAPHPTRPAAPITPASKPIEPQPAQPPARRSVPTAGGQGLPRAQAAILRVLAEHDGPLTNQQVAVLTGYSLKSSGFANALGALRSAGLATPAREPLTATDEGRARVGDVPPAPRGHDLAQVWLAKLGRAPRTLLQVLLDEAPTALTHDQLALAAAYSPTSSGFANALGQLRSLGLAHGGRVAITASSHLTGGVT